MGSWLKMGDRRAVDAYLTAVELSLLGKKNTQCIRIKPELFQPTLCMSQQGMR